MTKKRNKKKKKNLFLPFVISTIAMISMVITTIIIVNNSTDNPITIGNISISSSTADSSSENQVITGIDANGNEVSVSFNLVPDETIDLFEIDETVFTGEEPTDYNEFINSN